MLKPSDGFSMALTGALIVFAHSGLAALAVYGMQRLGWLDRPGWLFPVVLFVVQGLAGSLAAVFTSQRMIRYTRQSDMGLFKDSLFFSNGAMMMLIDPLTGDIQDVNPAAVEFYGYPREQLVGMNISRLDTLPQEVVQTRIKNAINRNQPSFYVTHRLASGEERNVEAFSGPARVGDRDLVFSIVYDVTDQVRVEAALRESIIRFEEALVGVRLIACVMDAEGRVTFCNDYFAGMVGWKKEEIIGKNFLENFLPASEETERIKMLNELVFGEQIAFHTHNNIQTRSGEVIPAAWNVVPLRLSGKLAGVVAVGEVVADQPEPPADVTERVRELTEIQRAGHCITSSLELNQALDGLTSAARMLLDCRCAAVMLLDAETRELEITAIQCAHPDGSPLSSMPHQAGDRFPADIGVLGQVTASAEMAVAHGGLGHPVMPPGAPGNGLIAAAPLLFQSELLGIFLVEQASDGDFNKLQSAILNVLADLAAAAVANHRLVESERQTVIRLKESQEQLIQSERLSVMGRMVGFLTHEINNPLQSLRAGMDLLSEAALPPEKQRQYIEIASREVDRLSRIVGRVLGANRPSTDLKARVYINLVLVEVLMLLETQLERKQIKLERCYAPDLPGVEGYFDQLHQMLLNMLLNALAAMEHGGTLTIRTEWDQPSGQVHIIIQDDGPGISPEALPHIFDPFFTTRHNGTGLGLSVCKNIVETHHGTIEVKSQPGQGATFIMRFPALPE